MSDDSDSAASVAILWSRLWLGWLRAAGEHNRILDDFEFADGLPDFAASGLLPAALLDASGVYEILAIAAAITVDVTAQTTAQAAESFNFVVEQGFSGDSLDLRAFCAGGNGCPAALNWRSCSCRYRLLWFGMGLHGRVIRNQLGLSRQGRCAVRALQRIRQWLRRDPRC